jgi:putative oxidoreductase
MNSTINKNVHILGRILLAVIFVMAAIGKIKDPAGTIGYMQSVGLPAILLWPTIALELLGGIAIIVGYKTRLAAYALALFSIVAAVVFHRNFADQMQMIMFLKDVSITGGLLLLASSGATACSMDECKKS